MSYYQLTGVAHYPISVLYSGKVTYGTVVNKRSTAKRPSRSSLHKREKYYVSVSFLNLGAKKFNRAEIELNEADFDSNENGATLLIIVDPSSPAVAYRYPMYLMMFSTGIFMLLYLVALIYAYFGANRVQHNPRPK